MRVTRTQKFGMKDLVYSRLSLEVQTSSSYMMENSQVSLDSRHGGKLLRMKSRKSELVNHLDTTLMEGRERLDGDHHGHLGIEQLYGYMVFDKVIYGILTTFNSFVFLKRQSPGILYISRMIPNSATTPTILKLLYYISHLCA